MRLGIDLGGTKIEIIVLDDTGRECLRRRYPTPRENYRQILEELAGRVKETEAHLAQDVSVGIAMPGAISSATGLVKNSNSTCLNGRPFQTDLENLLQRDVRILNDANCFALSEAVDGAGSGAEVVFGVITGTGCGGGVVIDRKPVVGVNAIAGEWGHNPMPWPEDDEWPGPTCYCGRRGCIEAFLAGPGLARDHFEHTGERLSPPEIAIGDTAAKNETLSRYERRFAKAIASVINIIDPDVIVWGGGLSNVERFYDNVPKHWDKFIFSDRVDTKLLRNMHGDSSGVRGAAWLWPDRK